MGKSIQVPTTRLETNKFISTALEKAIPKAISYQKEYLCWVTVKNGQWGVCWEASWPLNNIQASYLAEYSSNQ